MHDKDKDEQFEYPTIKDLYPLNKTVNVDEIGKSHLLGIRGSFLVLAANSRRSSINTCLDLS